MPGQGDPAEIKSPCLDVSQDIIYRGNRGDRIPGSFTQHNRAVGLNNLKLLPSCQLERLIIVLGEIY